MKLRNNVPVSIFVCAAKGEHSLIARGTIGIFIVDPKMHGHPHTKERSEALIKSAVRLTRYDNRMVFDD